MADWPEVHLRMLLLFVFCGSVVMFFRSNGVGLEFRSFAGGPPRHAIAVSNSLLLTSNLKFEISNA